MERMPDFASELIKKTKKCEFTVGKLWGKICQPSRGGKKVKKWEHVN